jgi:hypothetical protein
VQLFDIVRSAGKGEFVRVLAAQAGLDEREAEDALRALLPELGQAIRAAGRSRSGAAAVHGLMRDERYERYLDDPPALREPAAVADGERVLAEVMDDDERGDLIRRVAAGIEPDEDQVRRLLPRAAVLAMGALGQQLRDPSPEIPWFGTREDDQFGAPLLNALAALFGHKDDDAPPAHR